MRRVRGVFGSFARHRHPYMRIYTAKPRVALVDEPATVRPNCWSCANVDRSQRSASYSDRRLGYGRGASCASIMLRWLGGRCRPLGAECRERCDPSAPRLGRQSRRLLPVSDASECKLTGLVDWLTRTRVPTAHRDKKEGLCAAHQLCGGSHCLVIAHELPHCRINGTGS